MRNWLAPTRSLHPLASVGSARRPPERPVFTSAKFRRANATVLFAAAVLKLVFFKIRKLPLRAAIAI